MQAVRTGLLLVAATCVATFAAAAQAQGFFKELPQRFADSDIVFSRSGSMVPFLPLASLTVQHYDDTEVETSSGASLVYDLASVSQYAVLPVPVSSRDAFFVGEYLSYSNFDVTASTDVSDDFSVSSIGLPVGWLRQANDQWQLAGFMMPMFHNSDLDGSGWSQQVMGGAFGRYLASDNTWWLFGVFVDISPEEDFYIPYVGASWTLNEHWTLSAILPWPAVLYAPNEDWLLRAGASPSGASWNFSSGGDDVAVNYDAWDLDIGVERRLHKDIWLGARVGVGGLRGVRLSGSDFDWPDFDLDTSAFFAVNLNFRPSATK